MTKNISINSWRITSIVSLASFCSYFWHLAILQKSRVLGKDRKENEAGVRATTTSCTGILLEEAPRWPLLSRLDHLCWQLGTLAADAKEKKPDLEGSGSEARPEAGRSTNSISTAPSSCQGNCWIQVQKLASLMVTVVIIAIHPVPTEGQVLFSSSQQPQEGFCHP